MTLSKTLVTHGCCLWQPIPTTRMCFNCHQARTEVRDVLLQTQGIAWALGVEQPGTEQHPHRKTQLAVLLCWPFSPTSQSVSPNPFNNLFFQKKEILSFCFSGISHPMPLPPPPWNGSVPPHQDPARAEMMPHAHIRGKPGPPVLYSQKTLKSACQFTCKFILDATQGLQKKVY